MRRCRRKSVLFLLIGTCCISIYLFSLSVSLIPGRKETSVPRHVEPREVVMNGQREILNVNVDHSPPLTAAAPLSSSALQGRPVSMEAEVKSSVASSESPRPNPTPSRDCTGPWEGYPHCESKMAWMAEFWTNDPCYANYGVDGSKCSFQLYLSQVEHWCPPPPSLVHQRSLLNKAISSIQYNLEPLSVRLSANAKFDWISRRIQRSWPQWTSALKTLHRAHPFNLTEKRVLIHIGALTDKAGFKFAENADHGGPLGELVQWSDLIACLHLLGHKVEFSAEIDQLRGYLNSVKKEKSACPAKEESLFDVIYIDIVGLKQFKKIVGGKLQHYRCLFRVLDSFGTEPQFNFKAWKPVAHSTSKKREYGQTWGNWELNPRQFLTMYPHTPDNSFLGFVVGSQTLNQSSLIKKNVSLVYGKELYMWKDKRTYLDVVSRYFDVHATIGDTKQKKQDYDMSIVPGFVYNHGILNAPELQTLLKETKLFVGLGFPYEGPAPLEAIANGCFFLNPRIEPPINRDNSKFLKGKPTLRSLTSQNPYTEMFIGEPYVYTVNIKNNDELVGVLQKMASMPNPPPYLPYEFTYEGMLERVAVMLENQQFCSPHQWPPVNVLKTRVSNEGESCKDACYREGMVCEPELFPILNKEEAMEKNHLHCDEVVREHSVHGPSHHSLSSQSKCSLQVNNLLLSCVGSAPLTRRLCPCRTYRKGQVALCETCVR